MVRITEHNDWVVYCILGSVFLYIILLSVFQRDANVKDFLMQKMEDASNLTPTWITVSVVRCIMAAVLISQFIPVVPHAFSEIRVFGWELNKFGFTFITLMLFDILRMVFTALYYASVGSAKNLKALTLLASKYFFLESLVLLILSFVLYFYPVDLVQYFYGLLGLFAGSLFLKNMIYLFHAQPVLPEKWYYKFLYICTLQIVPLLVLWKFLFY